MNFNILTDYPLWFILFCILAGALYAFILYYREKKNEYSGVLRWMLAIIRSIAVSLIAFMLLNPLVKSVTRYTEKPVIVFAQDNSSSIVNMPDSSDIKSTYEQNIEQLISRLDKEYEVRTYSFGDEVEDGLNFNFNGKQTNISALLENIYNRYYQRNVGAMIVATDGIYNQGVNPAYADAPFNFPVYTIALGDTTIHLDVILNKVSYNKVAYLENEFPIEIIVQGRQCKGQSTEVKLFKDAELVERRKISFNTENDFKTLKYRVKATEPGLQKFRISVEPVAGEISLDNNSQIIYINVLEGKQKILLLANSPHPDIAAIREAVSSNINYQFDEFMADDFDGVIDGYNLLILHGLPSIRNNISGILSRASGLNLPVLFIITTQTQLSLFNNQSAGVAIEGTKIIYNEAQPYMNEDFALFSTDEKAKQVIQSFPPLVSPYGQITQQPSASTYLFQKIGAVPTGEPLMIFNRTPDRKTSVILGEGIWKWRLKNFAIDGNHYVFDDLISKTVQFLSLKIDKSFFRIFGKNSFTENEDVEFNAEVYNEIYQPDNEPEVKMDIVSEDGTHYPYTFTRTSDAYYLNAGTFPVGSYTWSANTRQGSRNLHDKGEFTVTPLHIEAVNTVADHNILYKLAKKYGGRMVYPDQLDELSKMIINRNDIKPVIYSQKKFTELLNNPWLLVIILVLVSVEWFIRKRAGGY